MQVFHNSFRFGSFVLFCFVAMSWSFGVEPQTDRQVSQSGRTLEVRRGQPVPLKQKYSQESGDYRQAASSTSYGQTGTSYGQTGQAAMNQNSPAAVPSSRTDITIRAALPAATVSDPKNVIRQTNPSVSPHVPKEKSGSLSPVQPSLPEYGKPNTGRSNVLERKHNPSPFEIVRQVTFEQNTTLFEFSNGLAAIIQERPKTEVATVHVYVRNTGSTNEGVLSGSGISHLVEHLVAGGATTQRTRYEIASIINRFGGVYNAWTSSDLTAYHINCTASDSREAIALLADLVNNSVFDKSRFDSEKAVIRQESLDARNDSKQIAAELLMQTVYRVHPRRYPVQGYADLFEAITLENVKDFYASRYVPNNQVVVVVGDVSVEHVLAEITQAWGTIPRGPELCPCSPEEPAQIAPRHAFREVPGKTCRALFAWPGTTLTDPDAYALDVLAAILSQGVTSRLPDRLQHKSQLALDVQVSCDCEAGVRGRFVVTATATPDNLENLQTEILDELYRLREFPVTGAELARARKHTQAALVFLEESGQNFANVLATDFITTGNPNFRAEYLAGLGKVSIEDIRRVAKKYITPEKLTKVITTPPGMLPRQVEKNKQRIDEDVQAITFPGTGLRLLTKKSNTVPLVNIQFSVLAGSLVETNATAGLSAVLAETLGKGSAKYPQNAVASYFDSIGSKLVVTAAYHTIRAEATVLKDDLNEAIAVMYDAFFNPQISQEAFQNAQKVVLGRIDQRSDNPADELVELFCLSLPDATPYHLPAGGLTESVKNLKLDDLRRFHREYFHPGNMVVSLFGDFDTTQAATELNALLQLKQFAPKAPSISFERTNELIQSIREHKKTARSVALGFVAWPTVSAHAQKEVATLTVLQTIFGGNDYPGGKLFADLRRQGLVNHFFAQQILGPVPGYLYIEFQTQPGHVSSVLDLIEKQVADIQQGKLTDEELQAVKRQIIASGAIKRATLAEKARQCSLDELYGLGFADNLSFNQRIQEVTLDDVVAAARRYIRQKIVVTTSPREKAAP